MLNLFDVDEDVIFDDLDEVNFLTVLCFIEIFVYTVCNLYSYMLFDTYTFFNAYWMRTLFSFVTLCMG